MAKFNTISGLQKRAPLTGQNTIKDVVKRLNETYSHAESHKGLIQDNFYENAQNVVESYTVPKGRNAMSTGPLVLGDDITINVSDGSSITIL